MNFEKFLRTHFLTEHLQWLLLKTHTDQSFFILTGVDPGWWKGEWPPCKIEHLKFRWQPSVYVALGFTFVVIILYFLISLLLSFLIIIEKWPF